jgi:putative phosphoribosyl transferase
MEDGTTYINEEIVRILEVSKEYIEKEKAKQIQEIKRRTSLYRGSRSYELSNMKNIVLVDDGAATGATVIAAARWIRRSNKHFKSEGDNSCSCSSKRHLEAIKKRRRS